MALSSLIRMPHLLRGNSRSSMPSRLLFVDTETRRLNTDTEATSWDHVIRCWSATSVRLSRDGTYTSRHYCGSSAESFWELLYSLADNKHPLWVFAHNIEFDLRALSFADELDAGRIDWQSSVPHSDDDGNVNTKTNWQGLVVLDGPPTIIETRVVGTKRKVVFADTLNYWRCSLADLGDSVELPKLPMPTDDASNSTWIDYCDRDVAIITRAVLQLLDLIRTHDLGNVRYTAAAQGLQAFRHRFMRHKILVHCDEHALRLERDAYYGGRVSIFRAGKITGPIYVLDVQSFYPSIMQHRLMPRYLAVYHDNYTIDSLRYLLTNRYCIAKVTIDSNDQVYPVRLGRNTIMANGKFTTVLHSPELFRALRHNHITSVLEVSSYYADVLFRDFVTELWAIRKRYLDDGNNVQADMIKLLLNGLPGKLGQRQITWIDVDDVAAKDAWGTERRIDLRNGDDSEYRWINWRVQRKRRPGEAVQSHWLDPANDWSNRPAHNDESANSCPAIAGAITAYGRELLGHLIEFAGLDHTYYCDTDCVHVDRDAYDRFQAANLIQHGELGKLALKHVANEAEYWCDKYYRLDATETRSGIRHDAETVGHKLYRQTQFVSPGSVCKPAIAEPLREYVVTIDRSRDSITGIVLPDGRVLPPRL